MKHRVISLVLVFVLIISLFTLECFATDTSKTEIEYLEDGSYIITTTQEVYVRATNTKVGTRTKSQYDSDNVLDWQVILRGEFTYTGTSSTCTSSTISVNIYDSAYSKVSSSSSKSGNTANGSATISRKVLGVTVATNTYPFSLSCDKNGNLY